MLAIREARATAATAHEAATPAEQGRVEPVAADSEVVDVATEAGAADARVAAQSERPQGDVFIDRGPELPPLPSEPRMRVMVRDPGTEHAYWHGTPPADAWTVEAQDDAGAVVDRFETPGWQGSGYLHAPVERVGHVELRRRTVRGEELVASVGERATASELPAVPSAVPDASAAGSPDAPPSLPSGMPLQVSRADLPAFHGSPSSAELARR
jgi:hypothetical protein